MNHLKNIILNISVEPVIFLYNMSMGLYTVIVQKMFMDKMCKVNLSFSNEICDDLINPDNVTFLVEVQRRVSILLMCTTILEAMPTAIISLFIGPWSDENGRKIPMILPLFGQMIISVILIANTSFDIAPAECILFYTIYSLCGGGRIAINAMTIGYISDVTSSDERTSRLSVLTSMTVTGLPFGIFLSSYLFEFGGYYAVYSASGFVAVLGAIYITFYIKETRESSDRSVTIAKSLVNAISIDAIKQVVASIKKPRLGYKRVMVFICICLLITHDLRTSSLTFLYTNKKFGWTEKEYALYSSVETVNILLKSAIILPFLSSVLKVHDAMIGLIGALGSITYIMVVGLATKGWMMYYATMLSTIGSLINPPIFAIVSKCVDSDEQGKLFSILSSLASLMNVVSSVLFSNVYNATVAYCPGVIWFIMAGQTFLVAIGFGVLLLLTFWHEDAHGPFAMSIKKEEKVILLEEDKTEGNNSASDETQ